MDSRSLAAFPGGNPDSKPFWDGCARGELLLQRCTACATLRHPPSPVCPNCLSDAGAWIPASGRGTVYTFTVVRQALARGWDERVPYVVAVIELDEGPKLLTNLIDADPETVAIGMPVEVAFAGGDVAPQLPLFRPQQR